MENRPQGREKHVTGQGKDLYKRGDGLGGGPVGRTDGYAGRDGASQDSGSRGAAPAPAAASRCWGSSSRCW